LALAECECWIGRNQIARYIVSSTKGKLQTEVFCLLVLYLSV
jgi:hypothetical protein